MIDHIIKGYTATEMQMRNALVIQRTARFGRTSPCRTCRTGPAGPGPAKAAGPGPFYVYTNMVFISVLCTI